jgi:hypothetical protein
VLFNSGLLLGLIGHKPAILKSDARQAQMGKLEADIRLSALGFDRGWSNPSGPVAAAYIHGHSFVFFPGLCTAKYAPLKGRFL